MAPRPDVSDQRRNQIMEAALTVFSRLGFERASMDNIAKEAGVSKGALYLYYKSKDAIIATVSWPWPCGEVPVITSTLPVASIRTVACSQPPAP